MKTIFKTNNITLSITNDYYFILNNNSNEIWLTPQQFNDLLKGITKYIHENNLQIKSIV